MAAPKKINRVSIVHLVGGQAKPGPMLASYGLNIGEFTKQFNEKTKDRMGEIVPTEITSYSDKSFTFITKTSPVTALIKKELKLEKGSKNPLLEHVGKLTKEQALKIARYKMADLDVYDEEAALRVVAGSAKQMGIEIEGVDLSPKKTAKLSEKGAK